MKQALLTAAMITAAPALGLAETIAPDYTAADFSTPGTNPYFPLAPGETRVIASEDERSELTNIGPGPVILGVQTQTQLDRAFEDGLLVEETFDYYAVDSTGTVWYFGEDVTNYVYDDDGSLIDTNNESAWRAGVDAALPGWIMPADPIVGLQYFQEIAPLNDAVDQARIHALDQTYTTESGDMFESVLVTFEFTELEPDARELKFYAPGEGLIADWEDLDPDLANPETVFELQPSVIPVPATLPLLLSALGIAALACRRKLGRS